MRFIGVFGKITIVLNYFLMEKKLHNEIEIFLFQSFNK